VAELRGNGAIGLVTAVIAGSLGSSVSFGVLFSNAQRPTVYDMNRPRGEGYLSSEERADLVCVAIFPALPEAHRAGTGILTMGEWYVVLPLERQQWGLHVRSAIAEETEQCVREVLPERMR